MCYLFVPARKYANLFTNAIKIIVLMQLRKINIKYVTNLMKSKKKNTKYNQMPGETSKNILY